MVLEVIVFDVESAILAAEAGAHRLEFCDNYSEGGTTPSYGNVDLLLGKVNVPVYPMVRPRGGDFLYTDREFDVMEREIKTFKSLGCGGVVLGCLNQDATVNGKMLRRFVELAHPMEVHFHRAFDRVKNQFAALETIIASGCKRILTSGGFPRAVNGTNRLKELSSLAGSKISIIAGGDVKSSDFPQLLSSGVSEFHTPARKMMPSQMQWKNADMNEDLVYSGIDTTEIRNILGKINHAKTGSEEHAQH